MKRSILRYFAVLLICLGVAFAGFGAWTLIRGEVFQASASVKIDVRLLDFLVAGPSGFYNPDFCVATNEMRFIKSDEILAPMVEKLELIKPFQTGASAQPVLEVCKQLRGRIIVFESCDLSTRRCVSWKKLRHSKKI